MTGTVIGTRGHVVNLEIDRPFIQPKSLESCRPCVPVGNQLHWTFLIILNLWNRTFLLALWWNPGEMAPCNGHKPGSEVEATQRNSVIRMRVPSLQDERSSRSHCPQSVAGHQCPMTITDQEPNTLPLNSMRMSECMAEITWHDMTFICNPGLMHTRREMNFDWVHKRLGFSLSALVQHWSIDSWSSVAASKENFVSHSTFVTEMPHFNHRWPELNSEQFKSCDWCRFYWKKS